MSAGCTNCYAMRQAHRFSKPGQPYAGLTALGPQGPRWTGMVTLAPDALNAPLHWKRPRRIFVNSMSDLFHEAVPDAFIDHVFSVMASSPRHIFQILTKRPARMQRWMEGFPSRDREQTISLRHWPLPNVWLGVSIEDQATAAERIAPLLATPAAVRFVSAEPLLGAVELASYFTIRRFGGEDRSQWINWVIVGGESGPGARPCDVSWIRTIKEQCQANGVPVFVKQIGSKPIYRNLPPFDGIQFLNSGGERLKDKKGGDMAEWPADLRVREFPR